MASNDGDPKCPKEASVSPSIDQENDVLSDEDFTEKLLCFFRNGLKNSFERTDLDQSELVRRSWDCFHPHFKVVRHEQIYVEMLFSVFEIFPFTHYSLICNVLDRFVFRRLDRYRFVRSELTGKLALVDSPPTFIHYYIDPLLEDTYSGDKFCSPALLLDFSAIKRLLRYGARFQINPLQTEYCLKSILVGLT